MSNRIAVFDLDGTISDRDTYLTFLLHCLKRHPARALKVPLLPGYVLMFKSGLRTNHWLKAKFLKAICGGLDKKVLDDLAGTFTAETFKNNIKPLALAELDRLRSEGYLLVLATASFDFYVTRLFSELGMDKLFCTAAEFDHNDRLTGSLATTNCFGKEKARRIKSWLAEQGATEVDLAYSDSKVDLPLLLLARDSVVVDPKTATERVAAEFNYKVVRWKQ